MSRTDHGPIMGATSLPAAALCRAFLEPGLHFCHRPLHPTLPVSPAASPSTRLSTCSGAGGWTTFRSPNRLWSRVSKPQLLSSFRGLSRDLWRSGGVCHRCSTDILETQEAGRSRQLQPRPACSPKPREPGSPRPIPLNHRSRTLPGSPGPVGARPRHSIQVP